MIALKTHNLDIEVLNHKGEGPAFPKQIRVVVKIDMKSSNSMRAICPSCTSSSELDYEIDRLIKELELIRRAGHRQFA